MPSMPKRRGATIDPDEMLVCLAAHWCGRDFFGEGDRVKRGNINSYSAPYWTAEGLDGVEIARLKHALEGSSVPQSEPVPKPVAKVRATKSFTTTLNTVAGGPAAPSAAMLSINVGDVLPKGHPVAVKYADAFESVS